MPYAGSRKMKRLLREHDKLMIGRKLVQRLMGEMGIQAIYPKPKLSIPRKEHKKFPYLLRNKTIAFPNQVWALDNVLMKQGHMYLSAIFSLSKRWIGMSPNATLLTNKSVFPKGILSICGLPLLLRTVRSISCYNGFFCMLELMGVK